MKAIGERLSTLLIVFAIAVVTVGMAVLPFLTPPWVAFEQARANATAWTGYSTEELQAATDAILADMVFGPPDFDVEVRGEAVLNEGEAGHMRDVRTVFLGLFALAAVSVAVLVVAAVRVERGAFWRSIRRGAFGLTAVVIVLGVVALVAFDALFEVFHTVLFPAGSYTFDPATERLVQLFPFQFWQETAVVVGVVIIAFALAVAVFAGRRAPRLTSKAASGLAATPEPSR